MHGVIRTATFLKDARTAGLSEDDQQLIVVAISENPMLGDLMPGTGGCRKVRFAGKGKGKRGGYRTVHYYAANDVPVVLLALISKGERSDLSKSEQNELKKEMAGYAEEYRAGVRKKVATLKR
jgi:hypothetical protein